MVEIEKLPRPFSVAVKPIWLMAIVNLALLIGLYVLVIAQFVRPHPLPRLQLLEDVPLPAALPTAFIPDVRNAYEQQNPLAPGLAVNFDRFDFQAFDPNTRLLFIAHTGPAPDKFHAVNPAFNPEKDVQRDGQVLVLDTRRNKIVGRVDIPQITGMVVAPDSGTVFASGSLDNAVYAIDERTLRFIRIVIGNNERPDAISYDPQDHKIFVSNSGSPSPDVINPINQNLIVIDTRNYAVTKLNLGRLPSLPSERPELARWGYRVGHNRYDATLHRVFVTLQQLTNPQIQPPQTPPGGTGELLAIDPLSNSVLYRVPLPRTCGTPQGMAIDEQQNTAFIACVDNDPAQNLVPNLLQVNLRTMSIIPPSQPLTLPLKPDILVLDQSRHMLFVGSGSGIAIFDEAGGRTRPIGIYTVGKGTHTIALDEATRTLYVPLINVGGRPTLRIIRYNPNGV